MFEDPYLPRSEETRALYELSGLFVERGAPDFSRSDNGSEFTAQPIGRWLQRLGVKTLFIEPGSPWENGYIESFNGKMRDELLNGEIFDTILETKVITERWRDITIQLGRTALSKLAHEQGSGQGFFVLLRKSSITPQLFGRISLKNSVICLCV